MPRVLLPYIQVEMVLRGIWLWNWFYFMNQTNMPCLQTDLKPEYLFFKHTYTKWYMKYVTMTALWGPTATTDQCLSAHKHINVHLVTVLSLRNLELKSNNCVVFPFRRRTKAWEFLRNPQGKCSVVMHATRSSEVKKHWIFIWRVMCKYVPPFSPF